MFLVTSFQLNREKADSAFEFPTHFPTSTAVPFDLNQDGLMDLFVGNRFHPQRYGIAVDSYVFINKGDNKFELSPQSSLREIGMVTAAAATDLNQDGVDDLVLVGEWMPITTLQNQKGKLVNTTAKRGLSKTSGLWNTIYLKDLNEDGIEDWLVGNLGSNNFFEKGMKMFVNDYDKNGSVEQLICKQIDGNYFPVVDKEELISQLPALKKKVVLFETYSKAKMTDLFTSEQLDKSYQYELDLLKSSVFLSTSQDFERQNLPDEAQYAPVYAFASVKRDQEKGLLVGGNQFLVKPQFGKYDASKGWYISYEVKDNKLEWRTISSLRIQGQMRQIKWLESQDCLLVGLNDKELNCYALD